MIAGVNSPHSGTKPIAISMGDPAGIGPEIIIKAWQSRKELALPLFYVLGSVAVLQNIEPNLKIVEISKPAEAEKEFANALPVININTKTNVVAGISDAENAHMVISAIEMAVSHVQSGDALAIVTAPINKHNLYSAGFKHKGHTDYLAHLCGQDEDDAVMFMYSSELSVVPLTIHIALKDVANSISQDKIIKTAKIMFAGLEKQFSFNNPRIAVTGLNPHAGENGTMGDEEIKIIKPAIEKLKADGHQIFGPFAADSLFSEGERRKYDATLAMYHDQALAPLKALDMRKGVNITMGLNGLTRTSPDHGTAYELAGKNMADAASIIEAIIMAKRLASANG